MLTTPLLGFMVYMEDTFIRKDSLLLLMLVIAVRGIFANRLSFWSTVSILIVPVIAILSHEIFSVLFLPASFVILFLTYLSNPTQVQTCLGKAACLLPSCLAALAVSRNNGSLEQALKIKSSWQSFFSTHPNAHQLGGSIGWLQKDRAGAAAAVSQYWNHEVVTSNFISITYGTIVILLFLLAIFFILLTIYRPDFRLFF